MSQLTFLEFNDVHWRGSNPRGRIDDYNAALRNKLTEIFGLAHAMEADAILIPGDITDTPGLGWGTVADLASLLALAPCPVLAIAGQHDEWGHNPGAIYRTPLGLLFKLGFLKDVASEPAYFTLNHTQVRVTGRHYDDEVDRAEDYYEAPPLNPVFESKVHKTVTIHLAHGLVVEKAPSFDLRCTPLAQLRTSAHVLCVGDYHPGIGVRKVGDTIVVNPGALGRLAASAGEMERQIQVAKIVVSDDGAIQTELIPLKSARPGHEVLSREHLEVEAEREERISRFLGLLAAGGEMRFLETAQIIEEIARRENLPPAVVREALERIGRAREQLGVA